MGLSNCSFCLWLERSHVMSQWLPILGLVITKVTLALIRMHNGPARLLLEEVKVREKNFCSYNRKKKKKSSVLCHKMLPNLWPLLCSARRAAGAVLAVVVVIPFTPCTPQSRSFVCSVLTRIKFIYLSSDLCPVNCGVLHTHTTLTIDYD